MLNIMKTGWNWTGSKLRDATEVSRLAILGCLGVIILMWLINIFGFKAVDGVLGLIGLVLVVFLTISPKIMLPSAAVAGLSALLSKNNPVAGALGGPRWVVSIARAFLYGFLFFATFLTFWSFENSPFAFWGIFLLAMMMFIWRERYGNGLSIMKWIEWSYIVVCGAALLWSTFGGVYHGEAFDASTGEPLSMVDQKTGHIDDAGRQPSDCRPEGAPHKDFNYAARGTCFSKETGERLVPISADQALLRQPLGIVSEASAGVKKGLSNISLPSSRSEGTSTGSSTCPRNVRVPMGASVQVTVPVDCIATVDTRGLPLDDRGIATDPDRNNPVADGKETSDFANIEYVYERGEIVGAKIAPHSGYAQAGVNTMTFVVFSRKMLPK